MDKVEALLELDRWRSERHVEITDEYNAAIAVAYREHWDQLDDMQDEYARRFRAISGQVTAS